jgi:hypothetical protein
MAIITPVRCFLGTLYQSHRRFSRPDSSYQPSDIVSFYLEYEYRLWSQFDLPTTSLGCVIAEPLSIDLLWCPCRRPHAVLYNLHTITTEIDLLLRSVMFLLPAMPVPVLSMVAGVAIIVFALYNYVLYPAFLSPLSKLPNAHFTSSISPAWILWTRYTERNNVSTHNAHRKHGPIVRLAPSEISINCVDGGIRTVYTGGMEKHSWYPDQFASYG